MIFVMLGTQNNSFHRLLEEVDKNIENGNIQEKVVVQAGFTKYKSKNMEIFDMVPQDKFDKLINEADIVITHGGVGSMVSAIKKGKKVIAVPRLKKYGEHVNDHQKEIIETFRKQGLIIGIDDVSELPQALKKVQDLELHKQEEGTNNIVKIIDEFIQNDQKNK